MGIFTVSILINPNVVKAKDSKKLNLKENIIPLKTVQAENGFEDLLPLKNILKNKKIVSVGEATHGTKEFFQAKHRMFEFLVEEMGYTLFAMEAGFGDARVVNDYILNGKGTAKGAVKQLLYWVWTTEEVLDMVNWMRKYNENPQHKKKIKFYGFDIQTIQIDKKKVLEYLGIVDIQGVEKFNQAFIKCDNAFILKDEEVKNLKDTLEGLMKIFQSNKDKYIKKSSKSEYEIVQKNLDTIYKFINLQYVTRNGGSYVNYRDISMAENVKWILDYEKQFGNDKIMLWAHNGHVSTKINGYNPMGGHLRNMFKDDMYIIGQEFNKGGFRALPLGDSTSMKNFNITEDFPNTFSSILKEANTPIFFMDFKNASKDKHIKEWLLKPQGVHAIGAAYSETTPAYSFAGIVPSECFDGVIFVENTTASVPMEYNNSNNKPSKDMIINYLKLLPLINLIRK
ncbi:erythromycin esterase family protein [Clostridium rectalis]|uniref:erythromycin esterase family protein n=1 Tax=Clostridium rectalis TaxID=2040295 RepID=UPI000F639A82|nr:erythromycin esterase family protein [Clostridium rectalis]